MSQKEHSKQLGATVATTEIGWVILCHTFVVLFLVTPCLVVATQPWMEWIPIKKNKEIYH